MTSLTATLAELLPPPHPDRNGTPMFQMIDQDGTLTDGGAELGIDIDLAQDLYSDMVLARRLDSEALALQRRYCQILWMRLFQATSDPVLAGSTAPASNVVMSVGRSSSFPLWNTAPARTSATRCGALTARQRAWAASISL